MQVSTAFAPHAYVRPERNPLAPPAASSALSAYGTGETHMSTSTDINPSDEFDDEQQSARNWRRQLEQDAREGREAKAQLATLQAQADAGVAAQRLLAVTQAGIDTTSGPGKLFADTYKGDPNIDAVKAAAAQYGLASAPVPQAEVQQHQQIVNASTGGGTPALDDADAKLVELQQAGDFLNGSPKAVLEWVQANGGRIDNSEAGDWWDSPSKYTGPSPV